MHNNYEVYFIYVICLNVQFTWFIVYRRDRFGEHHDGVLALLPTQTYILDADLILNCTYGRQFDLRVYLAQNTAFRYILSKSELPPH